MRLAFAVAVVLVAGCASSNRSVAKPVAAQQPQRACLHEDNETPGQRERRFQALRLARQINTAQYNVAQRNTGKFQPVANLGLTAPTLEGFEVLLTTDGTTYAFSLKDTTDPCLFGFFSDHKGTIFQGRVIQ
jgi:homoserine acetyltransferase